jgi:hypothetical protein
MDFRVRAAVLAAAWCFCGLVFAGANSWTALGPSGGQVQKIVYNTTTPSIVYSISIGGFARSQDGGVTWQITSTDFPARQGI